MYDINRQELFPLWASSIMDYKIDLTSNSIHFKLYGADCDSETGTTKEIWTQIDIYNVRMFCYAHDVCYNSENPQFGGSFCKEKHDYPESRFGSVDMPDCVFDEEVPEFLKEHIRAGKNILMEGIQAAEPGEANVKVFLKFNSRVDGSSPRYHADQNIVIDLADSALTISAEKIVINGKRFIWNQEAGTFLKEDREDRGTVSVNPK